MRLHVPSLATGARDGLPMLLGVVPFGLITGVSAVAVGIAPLDATLMSMSVYAGAAQLAAIALVGGGSTLWVVLLTTFMINLRHLMYGAALAPALRQYGTLSRAAVGAVLVDHTYAFTSIRFAGDARGLERREYALGVGVTLWVAWSAATAVGAYLGAQVPRGWHLDFTVPLMFLALLVPSMRNRAAIVAALVAGGLALALASLPFNLGLVIAALCGIAAGTVAHGAGRAQARP